MFMLVAALVSFHTTSITYGAFLLSPLILELFQQDVLIAIGFAHMLPHLAGILRACRLHLVGVPRACRLVARDYLNICRNRRHSSPLRIIHDGQFSAAERYVFLLAGIPIAFWFQFSGLVLEDPTRRGFAKVPIKGMGGSGSLFGPGLGPCQGRHCVGCLSARQHYLSKLLRMRSV